MNDLPSSVPEDEGIAIRVYPEWEKSLRVEEIGKRLDDCGDHTRKCNRLVLVGEESSGLVPGGF